MRFWTVEYGTFWALRSGSTLTPTPPLPAGLAFQELSSADAENLAGSPDQVVVEGVMQRFRTGRRCFALTADGQIATYGWVTCGVEQVGELERSFNLHDHEAYIWDCSTRPAWRRQGYYTLLLSQMIHLLQKEGVPLIWIGASRLNQPSVRGIAKAGFQQVLDLTYRRFFRLTLLWLHHPPVENRPLIGEAYRILLNKHERTIGRLALGWNP